MLASRGATRGRLATCRCRGMCTSRKEAAAGAAAARKDLSEPLAATYKPADVERGWYHWWEDHGFFRRVGAEESFVMAFPPPNVTGSLHLGHALTCSIQDAIARWQQMQGRDVVFIPGSDHAGIATQVVVERHLWATQRKTKHDLGREKFVDEVWKWKEEKGSVIYDQLRRLGSSLAWDRAVFTMDQHMSRAVTEAFVRLYDEGLVYRQEALVNWCCSLQSAISDIEVDHLHLTGPTELPVPGYDNPVMFGKMYDFAYRTADSEAEEVVVSTTRPETMLGDTAVMVHPTDPRYTHLHTRRLTHPLRRDTIPVITDNTVDPEFGTGAVKVTPAHSHEDSQVGQRHGLPFLSILDNNGRITDVVPEFEGVPRFEAREAVLRVLSTLGLYRGCRAHPMMVPRCSRTHDIIEPILKLQWFIRCKELAREASEAVESGRLRLVPDQQQRAWHSWLDNITDWCVSRQLWWGHRIPVYCVMTSDGSELWVAAASVDDARQKVVERKGIPASSITSVDQEQDVLDTWFSSALFPFASLGWPERDEGKMCDLTKYYPTTLLETGHDILFFWVARMVMLGLRLTGELPFKTVLLHGLLCDAAGHKMSKSRGNVIDPMDVIHGQPLERLCGKVKGSQDEAQVVEGLKKNFPSGIPECGADALRFTLCSTNIKNQLLNIDVTRMEQTKFFGNKIWQTFKFLLSAMERESDKGLSCCAPVQHSDRMEGLGLMDRWILSHLAELVTTADNSFMTYDLHLLTSAFLSFWQNHLCDVYLESIKPALKGKSKGERDCALQTLWTCVDAGLRVLSPFMPYLTEELYQRLPRQHGKQQSVMECYYPRPDEFKDARDLRVEEGVEMLLEVASAFRTLKTSYGISHDRVTGSVVSTDGVLRSIVKDNLQTLTTLGRISEVRIEEGGSTSSFHSSAVSTLSSATTVYLHLKGVVDPKVEVMRLTKRLMKLEKEEKKVLKRVTSPEYAEKSPPHIQEVHHVKLASIRTEMERLRALIYSLEDL